MGLGHRLIDEVLSNGQGAAELLERRDLIRMLLDLLLDLGARAEPAEARAGARAEAFDSKLHVAQLALFSGERFLEKLGVSVGARSPERGVRRGIGGDFPFAPDDHFIKLGGRPTFEDDAPSTLDLTERARSLLVHAVLSAGGFEGGEEVFERTAPSDDRRQALSQLTLPFAKAITISYEAVDGLAEGFTLGV